MMDRKEEINRFISALVNIYKNDEIKVSQDDIYYRLTHYNIDDPSTYDWSSLSDLIKKEKIQINSIEENAIYKFQILSNIKDNNSKYLYPVIYIPIKSNCIEVIPRILSAVDSSSFYAKLFKKERSDAFSIRTGNNKAVEEVSKIITKDIVYDINPFMFKYNNIGLVYDEMDHPYNSEISKLLAYFIDYYVKKKKKYNITDKDLSIFLRKVIDKTSYDSINNIYRFLLFYIESNMDLNKYILFINDIKKHKGIPLVDNKKTSYMKDFEDALLGTFVKYGDNHARECLNKYLKSGDLSLFTREGFNGPCREKVDSKYNYNDVKERVDNLGLFYNKCLTNSVNRILEDVIKDTYKKNLNSEIIINECGNNDIKSFNIALISKNLDKLIKTENKDYLKMFVDIEKIQYIDIKLIKEVVTCNGKSTIFDYVSNIINK